ncbi:UDP-glucuronosyl/UDP-glucosyltransferase, partial [Trema orientale]
MATPHENQFQRQSLSSVVVVMVPFPAQSHLNQLLQLSHVLSSYDIPVHYVGSTLHNSQVKSRASIPLHHLTKIHFHDFPTPVFPSSPLNPDAKTKFPQHELPILKAITVLRQPITALLLSVSKTARRLVVVYDTFMASLVQDVVSLPNAEAYSFDSASVFSCFAITCKALGRRDKIRIKNLPSAKSCFPSVFLNFMFSQAIISDIFKAGSLYNSCRAIEGSFIDILANDEIFGRKKMWSVGPLLETTKFKELRDADKWLFQWLDQQERSSVLYVSFGTTTTLSDKEIKELALGLERSGVKFIWVLRDADKVDISGKNDGRRTQLPDGFEERVRGMGMGMVVREWVSQVGILGHRSTGGFMSHCGWNSCMESISMGVPIAAWPMHSDQPFNAVLITDVLKLGVVVMEWRQRDELVSSSMITMAVRKLMASEQGDEIRKRAEKMGKAVKCSISKGGDSRSEWDSFIAHITRKGSSVKNHKIHSIRLKLAILLVDLSLPFVFGSNVFSAKKVR